MLFAARELPTNTGISPKRESTQNDDDRLALFGEAFRRQYDGDSGCAVHRSAHYVLPNGSDPQDGDNRAAKEHCSRNDIHGNLLTS